MNLLCRAELSRRPIKFITDFRDISFYNHCRSLPTDDMSYIALDQDRTIFIQNIAMNLFSRLLRALETIFCDNLISKEKYQQNSPCSSHYDQIGKSELVS